MSTSSKLKQSAKAIVGVRRLLIDPITNTIPRTANTVKKYTILIIINHSETLFHNLCFPSILRYIFHGHSLE
jgi:hypothetical protein